MAFEMHVDMWLDEKGTPRAECAAEGCPAKVVDGEIVCKCFANGTKFEPPTSDPESPQD